MEMVVTNFPDTWERNKKRREQLLDMMEVANINLRKTERYLGIFGREMTFEKKYALQRHLEQQKKAFEKMCFDYSELETGNNRQVKN